MTKAGRSGIIRIGIGGWIFPAWRGTFYPEGLPQADELAYAASHLGSIEINGTFYRTQSPESFAKWHAATPDDFVFALKGPRYATNRKALAEAGESIQRFIGSGITRLENKLGPINWQLAPTKRFVAEEFDAFLKLLPPKADGLDLRHAVEVRHDSFDNGEALAIARAHGVAIVLAGDSVYPEISEPTADFIYARIMGTKEGEPLGYSDADLDGWRDRARAWSAEGRDVFLYVISGDKVRNPAAAQALIARLG